MMALNETRADRAHETEFVRDLVSNRAGYRYEIMPVGFPYDLKITDPKGRVAAVEYKRRHGSVRTFHSLFLEIAKGLAVETFTRAANARGRAYHVPLYVTEWDDDTRVYVLNALAFLGYPRRWQSVQGDVPGRSGSDIDLLCEIDWEYTHSVSDVFTPTGIHVEYKG